MNVAELSGAALDWAVAKCEPDDKLNIYFDENTGEPICHDDWPYCQEFKPSTDWADGGPIIEREGIDLKRITDSLWEAEINANDYHNRKNGPTPLIAAMRCYVASKLGEEIEVPEELMEV